MAATEKVLAHKLCPLCTFEALSVKTVMSHLRAVHSNDPHFAVTCGLNGCGTTSRSFPALYTHVYRYHSDIIEKRKEPLLMNPLEDMDEREIQSLGTSEDPIAGITTATSWNVS